MTGKNQTYSKIEIDIADYIFANPSEKYQSVLQKFAKVCEKPEATVKRYYYRAKEYNKFRLKGDEKVKDEQRRAEIREAVKMDILSRNEALGILSGIAREKSNKSYERTSAIQQLSKMEGWDSPVKTESNLTFSDPFGLLRVKHRLDELD